MNTSLKIVTFILGLLLFIVVFRYLVSGRLNERNSLLWLVIALVSLALGAFPEMMDPLARLVGVNYAPTLLFLMSTLAMLGMMLQHSVEISLLQTRVRELAQQLAILRQQQGQLPHLDTVNEIAATDAKEVEQ